MKYSERLKEYDDKVAAIKAEEGKAIYPQQDMSVVLKNDVQNAKVAATKKAWKSGAFGEGVAQSFGEYMPNPAKYTSGASPEQFVPANKTTDYSSGKIDMSTESTYGNLQKKYTVYRDPVNYTEFIIPAFKMNNGQAVQLTDEEAVKQYQSSGAFYEKITGNAIKSAKNASMYPETRKRLTELEADREYAMSGVGSVQSATLHENIDDANVRRFSKGARSLADGAADNGGKLVLGAVSSGLSNFSAGMDAFKNPNAKSMAYYTNKALQKEVAEERSKMSNTQGVVFDLVQNIAQQLPSMMVSALDPTKSVASRMVIFATSYGNSYKYAKFEKGADDKTAFTYALANGLNEALLDVIASVPGAKGISGTVVKKFSQNLPKVLLKFVENRAVKEVFNVVGEGIEEDVQTAVENWLGNIFLEEDNDTSLFSEEALYSGLLGMFSAGILNAGSYAVGKTMQNAEYQYVGKEAYQHAVENALKEKQKSAGEDANASNVSYREDETSSISISLSEDKIHTTGIVLTAEEEQAARMSVVEQGVLIGLYNPIGSEARTMAERTARIKNGAVSDLDLGRLIAATSTDAAYRNFQISQRIFKSAAENHVDEGVANEIAALAVQYSIPIEFAPRESMRIIGDNGKVGYSKGEYNHNTGAIRINAALDKQTMVETVLIHELTHAVEKSPFYGDLVALVREDMAARSKASWDDIVETKRRRQSFFGKTITTEQAQAEFVADWMMQNVFEENFAAGLIARNRTLGMAIAGAFANAENRNRQNAELRKKWAAKNPRRFAMEKETSARIRKAEKAFVKALDSIIETKPLEDINDNKNENVSENDENISHFVGEVPQRRFEKMRARHPEQGNTDTLTKKASLRIGQKVAEELTLTKKDAKILEGLVQRYSIGDIQTKAALAVEIEAAFHGQDVTEDVSYLSDTDIAMATDMIAKAVVKRQTEDAFVETIDDGRDAYIFKKNREQQEVLEDLQAGKITEEKANKRLQDITDAIAQHERRTVRKDIQHEESGKYEQKAREYHKKEIAKNEEVRKNEVKRRREQEGQREHTALVRRILKKQSRAYNILTHPTKNNHYPPEFVQCIGDILLAIEESPEHRLERIRELQRQIHDATDPKTISRLEKELDKAIEANALAPESLSRALERLYGIVKNMDELRDGFLKKVYEECIVNGIYELKEITYGRQLSDLTIAELQRLDKLMTATIQEVMNAGKLSAQFKYAEVVKLGERYIMEMENSGISTNSKIKRTFQNFIQSQLGVERWFNYTCGFAKGSVGEMIGKRMVAQQKVYFEMRRKYNEHFAEVTKTEEFKKLDSTKEEDLVEIKGIGHNGESVKMTRGMMMGIYEMLCCDIEEVAKSGFTLPNIQEYYAGNESDAFAKIIKLSPAGALERLNTLHQEYRNEADPVKKEEILRKINETIATAQIDWALVKNEIENIMTPMEKRLHALTREWLDIIQREDLNKATMERWGFHRTMDRSYYPLVRDDFLVNKDFETLITDFTIESFGMLKQRVRNSIPIRVLSITDVISKNHENAARIYAYMVLMEDIKKIMNVHDDKMDVSVRSALTDTFGSGTEKIFNKLMDDIAGKKQELKGLDKLLELPVNFVRKNYVRSIMGINFRVVGSQTASYVTAAAELGWRPLAAGLRHFKDVQSADLEKIRKYSIYFYERTRDTGSQEEFSLAKEEKNVIDRVYNMVDDKTKGYLFSMPAKMDTYTSAVLWYACEAYVKENSPSLKVDSEEFNTAVGQKLDDVLRNTQSNNTIIEKADAFRSSSPIIKMLTVFKNDANQQFGILYEGYMRKKKYLSDYNDGKNSTNGVTADDIAAVKKSWINRLTGVFVGATVYYTLVRMLLNLILHREDEMRDEDGALSAEGLSLYALDEMLDNMSSMVLFGDIVYDVIKSRVTDEPFYEISDMGWESINRLLTRFATGDFSKAVTWEKVFFDLSDTLGVPLKNTKYLLTAITDHIEDIANGTVLQMSSGSNVTTTMYYRQLYKARMNGNTKEAERLRQYLLSEGKTEKEIESGVKNAFKMNDKQLARAQEKAIESVMANSVWKELSADEQKKVQNDIKGYLSDEAYANEFDTDMTATHQKAEKAMDKGISLDDYYLAMIIKTSSMADTNGDGKVSQQEFRKALQSSGLDDNIARLLRSVK